MKKILSALFISLLFTACGPVYKTHYDYFPPKDPVANLCIVACAGEKRNCIREEKRLYSECRTRQSLEETLCEANKVYVRHHHHGKHHHHYYETECVANCYCDITYCEEPDLDACEADYSVCYEACGGRVKRTQVCVQFCNNR